MYLYKRKINLKIDIDIFPLYENCVYGTSKYNEYNKCSYDLEDRSTCRPTIHTLIIIHDLYLKRIVYVVIHKFLPYYFFSCYFRLRKYSIAILQ